MVHTCDPNALKLEAGGDQKFKVIPGFLVSQASLGYMRPCLKTNKKRKRQQRQTEIEAAFEDTGKIHLPSAPRDSLQTVRDPTMLWSP